MIVGKRASVLFRRDHFRFYGEESFWSYILRRPVSHGIMVSLDKPCQGCLNSSSKGGGP